MITLALVFCKGSQAILDVAAEIFELAAVTDPVNQSRVQGTHLARDHLPPACWASGQALSAWYADNMPLA